MKTLALIFLIPLLFVFLWGLSSSAVTVTINGQAIAGPLAGLAGGWALVVSTVALFCAAILLAFIFAGVGLIILGVLALVGFILLATAFPFLLPVLIPLMLVWAVCAGFRNSRNGPN